MSSQESRISKLVGLLEAHPQASILIPLVEHIFNSSGSKTKLQLVQSFLQLCNNEIHILSEFEFIRGSVALEEGNLRQAMGIFWNFLHFQDITRSSWIDVIEILVTKRIFIQASLFLRIALDRFPQVPRFLQLAESISPVLRDQLKLSPGIDPSLFQPIGLKSLEQDINSSSSSEFDESPSAILIESLDNLPSAVRDLWNQALECFEEFSSSQDSLNGRAFIHYAHYTVRELLGVEGSFRERIDQIVTLYKLSQFREFLIWLNQIRNKVFHEDYLPTIDEIHQIYQQTLTLLQFPIPYSQNLD